MQGLKPVELSPENLIINSLIREYLDFNGYVEAASVLEMESGMGKDGGIERTVLAKRLGISEGGPAAGSTELPLLYSLVAWAAQNKEEAAAAGVGR